MNREDTNALVFRLAAPMSVSVYCIFPDSLASTSSLAYSYILNSKMSLLHPCPRDARRLWTLEANKGSIWSTSKVVYILASHGPPSIK